MKFDFLNDLTLGTVQKSGPMTVVPLLGKDATDTLASFSEVSFERVATYGDMVFKNESEKPFILPAGYAIMTKQAAQDHAIVYSTVLPAKETTTVDIACCIQQTQCGYIDGKGVNHFNFLPIEIRKNSVVQHTEHSSLSFSRLWPLISDFQNKLVKGDMGNLILFFNKYMDKLVSYNAEFECVPNQRGAMIFVDGELVGIEIAPTHDYWKTIWNPLIRDSYGSTVLKRALANPVESYKKNAEDNMFKDCKTPTEMLDVMKSAEFGGRLNAMDKLEKFVANNNFKELAKNNEEIKPFSINGVEHVIAKSETNAVIDVYTQGNKILYLSMLA